MVELEKSKQQVLKRRPKKEQMELTAMLLPGLIFIFIFCYLPMGGLVIAFKEYRFDLGIFGSPWNGLDNFKYLFESQSFYIILRNTIAYNFVFIVLGAVVSVFLALMLSEITSKMSIKIFESCMFIPNFLSWVVISYISYAFFQYDFGLINKVLQYFGKEPITFYTEQKYWPFILVFFNIWKGAGYGALMYYGSILGIDSQLYDAAIIDGCGYVKRIRYVTLPCIRHTIIIMTLLGLGNIFRSDYGLFYYIPRDTGALYQVTDVIDTYILRALQISGSIGGASAVGFLQSIVGFILVATANFVVGKIDNENTLF